MAKRSPRIKNQSGRAAKSEQDRQVPALPVTFLWPLVSAGFGGLVVLGFLAPCDSTSVYQGTTLPGIFGWLALGVLSVAACHYSSLRVNASRFERIAAHLGLAWYVIGTMMLAAQANGRAIWNGFWQVMALVACYYILRAILQSDRTRATLLLILVTGCTSLALDGLGQTSITMPASRAEYARDPERVLQQYGIDAPEGSPKRKAFEDRLNSPEPFATFALANSLATLLCGGAILTFYLLIHAIRLWRNSPQAASLSISAVLLISLFAQLACLLLTRSRTAYLALLFGLAVGAVLSWGTQSLRRQFLMPMIAVALGLVGVAVAWVFMVDPRVATEALKSLGYRVEYWQATLGMILDRPLLGVGLGNFQAIYPRYKLAQASETIADPHNWILDIAVSMSVPIAVLIVGWIVWSIVRGCRLVWTDASDRSRGALFLSDTRELDRGMVAGAIVCGVVSAFVLTLFGMFSLETTLPAWFMATGVAVAIVKSKLAFAEMRHAAIAAAVAMLTCLLFSGAWQAPGIAVPLLILIAWMHTTDASNAVADLPVRPMWSWSPMAPAAAAMMIFIIQTWRPVTDSWRWTEELNNATNVDEQLRYANMAATADILDPERQLMVAQALTRKALLSTDGGQFETPARQAVTVYRNIKSENQATFSVAGHSALELADAARRLNLDPQFYLENAGKAFRMAAQRYPSSIELQLQCAVVSSLLEQWTEAGEFLEKSEALDAVIPHLDKKLAAQLLWMPIHPGDFVPPADAGVPAGYVRAEPFVTWLRTKVDAK